MSSPVSTCGVVDVLGDRGGPAGAMLDGGAVMDGGGMVGAGGITGRFGRRGAGGAREEKSSPAGR